MSKVEWKKLSDVAVIKNGKDYKKLFNGNIPVFGTGGVMTYVDQFASDKPSVLLPRKGSVENIFYVDEPFWTVDTLYWTDIDTSIIAPKFLFVSLQRYNLKEFAYGGARPSLSQQILYNLDIPLPSLSEQNRIVGILDTFTSSIEILKEQIAERRKQYEHYRDQLLDLEGKDGVDRIELKDICEVINGRAYKQQELLNEGKYRVLRVGNFFSNDSWYYSDLELEDKYYCEEGDLLYAWSASFGPHIWSEEKVIYHYHIWKMVCGGRLNKRYMYFWLQSEDMKKQAFANLHGATMAHLTKALMESLMVSVPSIDEQNRIVSILDTFEASISNLEAQLEEREKQYEYYRNKLLTFE